MTKVAFKIEVNPSTKERSVFAFFPTEKEGRDGEMFTSYSRAGQHSPCAKSYFDHCKWATYLEYAPLYDELVRIGYNDLKVLNKDFAKCNNDDFGYHVNGVEARAS